MTAVAFPALTRSVAGFENGSDGPLVGSLRCAVRLRFRWTGEEPVVAAGEHSRWYGWPFAKSPRLGEDRRPLVGSLGTRAHHLGQVWRQIVEEQRLQIGDIGFGAAFSLRAGLRIGIPADGGPSPDGSTTFASRVDARV
jgi:hypothetical protein